MKPKLQCQLLSWMREELRCASMFPDGADMPEVMTEIFHYTAGVCHRWVSFTEQTTEGLRLEGTFGNCQVQSHCWSKASLRPVTQDSVQVILGITKTGDSTTSLCNLCQCSVTLTVSWCSDGASCILVCACYLWCWHRIQPVSIIFALSFRYLCTLIRFSPELFCSKSFLF